MVQEGDVRSLLFLSEAGETLESQMSVSDPARLRLSYTRQMMAALALWESRLPAPVEQPRLLLVGLGGASLSKAVARQYPEATVVTVEIEPVVVEAARAWFGYRETSRVLTVVADARHYLETTAQSYDVILLDAFDEEGAPHSLATQEFFQLLEQRLSPRGVVVSNVHYDPWAPAARYLKGASLTFPYSYAVHSPYNGAVVLSREPLSTLPLWENREHYTRLYELPVVELLNPRFNYSLDGVLPLRDLER